MAKKIMRNSAITLSIAKSAINYGAGVDLGTGLEIELQSFAQCFATEDQKEGMQAFIEKRKPQFKNR